MLHHNLVGAGRVLIGNKGAPVGTIGIEEDPSLKVAQVASVVAKNTYKVEGVLAHYIVFGQDSLAVSEGKPMRAVFGEAEDAVVFYYKIGGTIVYLYGMTIPALLDWTPPSKPTDMINESALLQSWKATHSDLKELVPLVNTGGRQVVRELLLGQRPRHRRRLRGRGAQARCGEVQYRRRQVTRRVRRRRRPGQEVLERAQAAAADGRAVLGGLVLRALHRCGAG